MRLSILLVFFKILSHSPSQRAGSGFKLHVDNLKTLSLTLGQHTTSPSLPIAVSVNYGPFTTVNVSTGVNSIPLGDSLGATSVIRINSPGWQNNRMNLERITLNSVSQAIVICILVLFTISLRMQHSFLTPHLNSRFNSLETRFLLYVVDPQNSSCQFHTVTVNSCTGSIFT